MAVIPLVLNGTNLTRDNGIQSMPSAILTEGVLQNFENELEVTLNSVAAGLCFVEVTRTTVTPNETFKVPVRITAATTIDTTGTGWVIVKIDQAKVNDGSANAEDGTGIATVEAVTVLPSDPYVILATLAAGVITDAREWSQISEYVSKNPIYYDEDVVGTDSYAISVNGVPALLDGMEFRFKAATANTGAATLNVNAIGAKTIKRRFNQDIVTGDILAGQIIEVVYDADTDTFQMLSMLASEPATLDLADTSEALDGTNDAKYMSPLKVRQAIDQFRLIPIETAEDIDGTTTPVHAAYGSENMRDVINIRPAGGEFVTTTGTARNYGQADATTRVSQSFTHTDALAVSIAAGHLTLFIKAPSGTPSGINTYVSIETDNGSGSASGTVITNGNSANVAGGGFTNAWEPTKFTWATPPTFSSGVRYHLVIRTDSANNAGAYFAVLDAGGSTYAGETAKTYTASTTSWSDLGVDLQMQFVMNVSYGGKIVKCDADHICRANGIGFVVGSYLATETADVIKGQHVTYAGLTDGATYVASTTPGELVIHSSSPTGTDISAPKPHVVAGAALGGVLSMSSFKKIAFDGDKLGAFSAVAGKYFDLFIPTGFRPDEIILRYFYKDDSASNADGSGTEAKYLGATEVGGTYIQDGYTAAADYVAVSTGSVTTALMGYGLQANSPIANAVTLQEVHDNGVTVRLYLDAVADTVSLKHMEFIKY